MSSQVLYNSPSEAIAVTSVDFVNGNGATTDPVSVTAVVTDPTGTITNFTYTSGSGYNVITKTSPGNYSLTLDGISVAGLYTYVWIGTGNGVQQVTPGTFRLVPLGNVGFGMQFWYTGLEELKSRLSPKGNPLTDPNYHNFDYEMQLSIHAVANWINRYCGRHFYQLQETRTYMPVSIWELPIDDIVPSTAASTVVNLDYDGDGIFETAWGNPASPVGTGNMYALKLGTPSNYEDNYNPNAAGGVARPYTQLQAFMAGTETNGAWLPFVWPYTHMNRVQVITNWGWDYVPPEVQQASLMLCTDIYKSKDTPWGMAGTAESGLVRVQSNPWVVELLRPYINPRKKWGV
jgi:hypothetical protein